MDEITITLTIADRPYRLKIGQDEEPVIRKAVELINEKIREYSNNYAFKDKQDLLAMAALHFGSHTLRLERDGEPLILEKLKELDSLLGGSLDKGI